MRQGRLYERNGFHADLRQPGDTLQGEIWVTRHGGYSGQRAYVLGLSGDCENFTLIDKEEILERDKPVRVRFSVKVRPGLYVAFCG